MIKTVNISKKFENQPILDQVNFEVAKGESLVILGQSGAGKSVLLKILAKLIVPDSGEIIIHSKNIGMLFQKNALFDSFTVYENLEFPLREHTTLTLKERETRIQTFLNWVALEGTEDLFPDELSGGMQKRLGIARALIVNPDVIFYDEPTAGLDPITSRVIADLILRLRQEFRTTIVAVTSDVLRAYQLADQIGLLIQSPKGATLISAGTPDQTKKSEHPAIIQFVQGLTKGPLTNHAHSI